MYLWPEVSFRSQKVAFGFTSSPKRLSDTSIIEAVSALKARPFYDEPPSRKSHSCRVPHEEKKS